MISFVTVFSHLHLTVIISGPTVLVRTLAASHGNFRNLIKTLGRTALDDGSALHRTTQDRKARTNIHALSGIRTQDFSVQAIKAFVSDHAATGADPHLHLTLHRCAS
jgi:hypothetical protein